MKLKCLTNIIYILFPNNNSTQFNFKNLYFIYKNNVNFQMVNIFFLIYILNAYICHATSKSNNLFIIQAFFHYKYMFGNCIFLHHVNSICFCKIQNFSFFLKKKQAF